MSNSVSNLSFRYHPEDENDEDSYDTSTSISTSNITVKSEGAADEGGGEASSVLGRLGLREETDKWKLFREVKGRITKSVEEKIEEIKTERLKNQSKQRRSVLGQMENSSVSDSEEQSESSQPSASDKSTKSAPETFNPCNSDDITPKEVSDVSGSQDSTPERSTTPVPTPEDPVLKGMELSPKKGKSFKNVLRRRKGKTKSEPQGPFDKSTISYSALVGNDSDSEQIELAQEVKESQSDESQLAQELSKLVNPTPLERLQNLVFGWYMITVPLVTFVIHWWFIQLPQYLIGAIGGIMGVLMLQRCVVFVRTILGDTGDPPLQHLKDLLPLKGVPLFRRSIYDTDVAETTYEGWMNEYTRDYKPETCHITLTHTVYVRLEGSMLRLSSPRTKIPKRALWNEPRYKLHFSRERLYDISNCQVQLKPDKLIHRRSWSKKYPICITLTPTSLQGVRYREKDQDTVSEDSPWVQEDKYTFETVSEVSDSEEEPTVPFESVEQSDTDITNCGEQGINDEIVSIMSEEDQELLDNKEEKEDDEGDDFVKVSGTTLRDNFLYLFARTDREKEIWFRRLVSAAKPESPKRKSPKKEPPHFDYLGFMLNLSQRTTAHIPSSLKEQKCNPNLSDLSISTDMMWLNAFFGRVVFDVFQDPDKLVKIQEKIQRKLSTIKLPIFLEKLVVSHLDLGQAVPIIQRVSRPTLNSQGVWVDLDIVYEGGFKMTVDTKMNLDRIKQLQAESPSSESPKSGSPAKAVTPTPSQPELLQKSAVYDSEVEDSAETSSEEPDLKLTDSTGPVVKQKYLRFLDKVAQSKYFQQVVDYKFIKKFVSNNNLQLVVEVKGLLGTLVLNIPPPPSDRLWYGFRTNPKLWLSAQPKFGQHAVHVISRIIEKKLSLEFQRILVLPNMDDLLVPIMNHNLPS